MIQENNPDGGVHGDLAPAETFPGAVQAPEELTFKPNSNYIWLDHEKALKVGEIFLPNKAKGLEWMTAKVLAAGPECKCVAAGDEVLLATKGCVGGDDGVLLRGSRFFFTQENMVVAVIRKA